MAFYCQVQGGSYSQIWGAKAQTQIKPNWWWGVGIYILQAPWIGLLQNQVRHHVYNVPLIWFCLHKSSRSLQTKCRNCGISHMRKHLFMQLKTNIVTLMYRIRNFGMENIFHQNEPITKVNYEEDSSTPDACLWPLRTHYIFRNWKHPRIWLKEAGQLLRKRTIQIQCLCFYFCFYCMCVLFILVFRKGKGRFIFLLLVWIFIKERENKNSRIKKEITLMPYSYYFSIKL